MTIPTPEAIRSKSSSVDSVFARAIEMQRQHTPLDEVVAVIEKSKHRALEFIQPVLAAIKSEDPKNRENLSAEQLLANTELLQRFRAKFADLFQIKLNRNPTTVEQGRIIDPIASTKAILIGAAIHATSSETSQSEST
ncbi:hypothetical protein COU75_01055 [Candidatus Peregrinibacteria bacterium CG10_big_fil_rev_8_21_14_0_10_42_8]|nr:MAG: hypothetical protein COU75_01055 [Candidatus Peregrinibacteria bacterium CG10_big_fil_rev_8_21_14_0_10_42_8]